MRILLLVLLLAAPAPAQVTTTLPSQTAADVLRPVCESLEPDVGNVSDADYDAVRAVVDGGAVTPPVVDLLERVRPQMDAVADAVKLPSGGDQWMDLTADPVFPAKWVMQIRRLDACLAADAVRLVDAGQPDAAFARLHDGLGLAKLLVDQPDVTLVIFGRNVGRSAMLATGLAAAHLSPDQCADLRGDFLKLLQTAEATALRQDGKETALAFSRMAAEFGDPSDVDPLLLPLINFPPDAREKWENPVERERMTRAVQLAYESAADALEAAREARAAKVDEAKRHVTESGWIGRATGPSVDLFVDAHDRSAAWFTLAAAGLDVRVRGPAALADHPDPTDGLPFDYADTGGGAFVLTSRHTFKDEPLTFRVDAPRPDAP